VKVLFPCDVISWSILASMLLHRYDKHWSKLRDQRRNYEK
jgi:hypothetical protein